jgi:formate dehydrogenase iron-sulfur subunit
MNNTSSFKGGKAVLVDLTRCIGCRGCQVACKSWNNKEATDTRLNGNYTNPPVLSQHTYTNIRFVEQEKDGVPSWSFVKDQCFHCKEPACASACLVGAIEKTPSGAVTYTFEKCMGCRYCMMACPFHIPKYEWDKVFNPWVRKCTFCGDRLANNMVPACIKTCPTNVMYFDDYDKVVAEAEKRLKEKPGQYVNHIYGKEEAGGTGWMYLSAVPFDQIGFNVNIRNVSYPSLTWASLSKIPVEVGGLAALVTAIALWRNRGSNDPENKQTAAGKEE